MSGRANDLLPGVPQPPPQQQWDANRSAAGEAGKRPAPAACTEIRAAPLRAAAPAPPPAAPPPRPDMPQMALPAAAAAQPASPKARVLPPVKPPRIIVEHFDIGTYKVDQAHGYVEANCQHCGATIRGQRNVTSNFIQHMRRRHPEGYDRFAASSTHRAKRPRLAAPTRPAAAPAAPHHAAVAAASAAAAAVAAAASPLAAAIAPPSLQTAPPRPAPTPARPRAPAASVPPTAAAAPPPRPELTLETALVSATYRAAARTPCTHAPLLSRRLACTVYIKREDEQLAGSPIFRAAYNFLSGTPTSRGGLVAAGPAALPVAVAAHKHAKPCLAVVAPPVPPVLQSRLALVEAKMHITLQASADLTAVAAAKAEEMNRTFVDLASAKLRPGTTDASAGYATLALELLQQQRHPDRIFINGGNALLFEGVATVLQRVGRGVKLIGVVLDPSCDTADPNAVMVKPEPTPEEKAGQNGATDDWTSFADDVVRVGRSDMCAAVKAVFDDCDGCLLEPLGALSVAGAVKYSRQYKLAHERVVCVVDSPLQHFDQLRMVTSRSWQADGSQCLLCVQRRNDGVSGSTPVGLGAGLTALMRELSGTAGGNVRVTSIRFRGTWPLLLGLACDETTTAAAHVANLTSLGYAATDVTGSELTEDELWMWNEEGESDGQLHETDAHGNCLDEGTVRWVVFRVEIGESTSAVVSFLAAERTVTIGKVCFSRDGGPTARLLVAAQGAEWQLANLEREMAETARSVSRVICEVNGLRVLGCGSDPKRMSNGNLGDEGAGVHLAADADATTMENAIAGMQVQPEVAPEVQPQVQAEVQPEVQPEVQTGAQPEVQGDGHAEEDRNHLEHGDAGACQAVQPRESVPSETAPHDGVSENVGGEQEEVQHGMQNAANEQEEQLQHEGEQQEIVQAETREEEVGSGGAEHHEDMQVQGEGAPAEEHGDQDDAGPSDGGHQDAGTGGGQNEHVMGVNEDSNELEMTFVEATGDVAVPGGAREEDGEGMEVERAAEGGDDGRLHDVVHESGADGDELDGEGAEVGVAGQDDVDEMERDDMGRAGHVEAEHVGVPGDEQLLSAAAAAVADVSEAGR